MKLILKSSIVLVGTADSFMFPMFDRNIFNKVFGS